MGLGELNARILRRRHSRTCGSTMKLDNPILNSPFEIPSQYWALDDAGKPTGEIVSGRRRSEYIVPIATSKRKSGGQEELVFTDIEGIASTRANVSSTKSGKVSNRGGQRRAHQQA